MEPIDQVKWDVVLTGTSLAESLLALSLSRSDKKVLHLDRNRYYGGAEAALSLQDVEDWIKDVQDGGTTFFQNARLIVTEDSKADGARKLGFSRAYSLALAPQIINARSSLIPVLVSSKVYRQLEFLAMGSWWIYEATKATEERTGDLRPSLRKIPTRREDIFEEKTIDLRAKRALIKFLRLAVDEDAYATAIEEFGDMDLESYLSGQFGIPPPLQAGLHALTLSPRAPRKTPLSYALPRITRHLGSFGVFGAGFNAVIPKWGGIAEVAQVACRALAVGGGVYMLGADVREQDPIAAKGSSPEIALELDSGDAVRTTWVAGVSSASPTDEDLEWSTRSISIVTSELSQIFPSLGEGAPRPAAAVVVFPAGSLDSSETADIPVYLAPHSSDTGECPSGQAIIYASIRSTADNASTLLSRAVEQFLTCIGEEPRNCVRWVLEYQQCGLHSFPAGGNSAYVSTRAGPSAAVAHQPNIHLPPPSLDITFDDRCLDSIRAAWQAITGNDNGFMEFEDREKGANDSDEGEN